MVEKITVEKTVFQPIISWAALPKHSSLSPGLTIELRSNSWKILRCGTNSPEPNVRTRGIGTQVPCPRLKLDSSKFTLEVQKVPHSSSILCIVWTVRSCESSRGNTAEIPRLTSLTGSTSNRIQHVLVQTKWCHNKSSGLNHPMTVPSRTFQGVMW